MTVEQASKLFQSVQEVQLQLAKLGIRNLEVFASGKPPKYLVAGFATDAAHLVQIETALAAYGNVESDVVPEASRKSGPVPSSLDGDPSASEARKAVRARLDIGAVCRARNDYDQAIRMSLQAANMAREAKDFALEALAVYAEAYFLFEGKGMHRQKQNPSRVLASAEQALAKVLGVDPILERNVARLRAKLGPVPPRANTTGT
jgi:hypothetical protein